MRGRNAARGGAAILATAGVAFVLTACGLSARTSAVTGPRCGPETADVLGREAGYAAHQIYANEVHGTKVFGDRHQVETYAPLLGALRRGDGEGVRAAVASLVSHTHIVRLRVSSAGVVRADVGGPLILAPVSGGLHAGGRTIGHYVLSVQDDLGYVKLVTRFVGVPVVLRRDATGVPVEGALANAPPQIPDLGQVNYRGRPYAAYSFIAHAFPSGNLRVSLLAPLSPSLVDETCAAVKAGEARVIAQRTARRYRLEPDSLYPYAAAVHRFTGGEVFIHAGPRPLTGSSGRGPRHLPAAGSVAIAGIHYRVTSFGAPSSLGRVAVFVLIAE